MVRVCEPIKMQSHEVSLIEHHTKQSGNLPLDFSVSTALNLLGNTGKTMLHSMLLSSKATKIVISEVPRELFL